MWRAEPPPTPLPLLRRRTLPLLLTPAAPAALVTLTGTEVDLSKHVGHSVALTGSYASPNATVGTSGTEKPATPARRREEEEGGKDLYGQVAEDGFPDLLTAGG